MIEILQELKLKNPDAVLNLVHSGHNIVLELWIPDSKKKGIFTRCVVADMNSDGSGLALRATVNGKAMPYYDAVVSSLPEFNPMAVACLTMIE